MTQHLTPSLNELSISVVAPAIVLADADGRIPACEAPSVRGWFVDDVRLLSALDVSVRGSDLDLVRADVSGTGRQEFTYVARRLGGWLHDPTVTLDVRRTLTGATLEQELVVTHRGPERFELDIQVTLAGDLATMAEVRQGHLTATVPAERTADGLAWRRDGRSFSMAFDPSPDAVDAGFVAWRRTVEPGQTLALRLLASAPLGTAQFGPGGANPWDGTVRVDSPDRRLGRLVDQSVADLGGLLLRDGDDVFLAAGGPWFLTLFGRDSLWSARFLMPFGTDLALSTLRVLARRQGDHDDPSSGEQPGKILHEVRNTTLEMGGMSLPPIYFGTVDATPLFVCTLADAWQWGADREQVAALLPTVRRCLEWVLAQSAESGWLRYVDTTGRGLANQGWKDSVDSVQFADGRLADPPIALSEVQAYAYEAAVRGAALLESFGERPVPGLTQWADDLRERFRRAFWVHTEEGGHVAIALDVHGVAVDSVTSNMGHLLGTGLLAEHQVARVVKILRSPELSSGFGLRTLTSTSPRYSRLSYHGGSVWPHDTAVAVRGLALEGRVVEATELAAGVLRAAEWQRPTSYRLPELYGGDSADAVPAPCDYPAACRPQAWAAAAPLACLVAATGLEVDVPGGHVGHPAAAGTALGPFTIGGVRAGDTTLTIRVDAEGRVSVEEA